MSFMRMINGTWEEFTPEPAVAKAYEALRVASARIGTNNYRSGLYRQRKKGLIVDGGYNITVEHRRVIDAMDEVLRGTITPNDAMALLWEHDVFKQRVG